MSALAHLIEEHHGELLDRFAEHLYATSVPEGMDRDRALDSAAEFLRELAQAIRDPDRAAEHAGESESAKMHGEQRFGIGHDVASVIREYRGLGDVIFELVAERGDGSVPLTDLRAMTTFLMRAAATATEHYAAARDAEVARQSARHIGFLAHELRNPLGSATLALTLAKEAGDVRGTKVTEMMERALSRLHQLVDGALVEVRLREGIEPERMPVDLGAFLGEITEESEIEARSRQIELDLEVEGEIELDADPRLLRSAVSNLVRNAIKFSHPGGAVRVRARSALGRVIVDVEDSCGGLPPGAEQKMFDPFVQRGHDRSGFGLGLAIATQAARAHEGSIRVNDLPGRGCVFTLDLPARG